MRIALYARYSSDQQRDASIADQLRLCRLHAEKQGWRIVEEYTDHAISGASLLRPGIQALIADTLRGRFDIVLAEAMDRLSRDQEDIAGLHKRMAYAGVKIVTLSEGEVTHLHVGLKGTMNALFLKDLADKTRRGQRGRIEQGKSGGGNAYGYDVVRKLAGDGTPIRGDRAINDTEARVVRRIFADYAAGKSAQCIAAELNRDGIPAPGGGDWGFSTINGNPKRGNGILNNEMYVGRLVWNRQRFIKDPDTGKRQARPNPESEWVVQNVPELCLLDGGLWNAVKERQQGLRASRSGRNDETTPQFRERRRPKYLFSGLTRCACCGGGYTMISATLVGCATARNKGTCGNRLNIRRDRLEDRVLNALRHHLMDPALFKEFCEEFTREMNRLRIEGRASIDAAQAELGKIEREYDRMLDLYLKDALPVDVMKERSGKLESRRTQLRDFLAVAQEPPPLLHPEMAGWYRSQIENLQLALREDAEHKRLEAAEIIRSLISEIVLTPAGDELQIDVRGDLAGILRVSCRDRRAGTPKGRPGEAAFGRDVASQFEVVAGAGNYREQHCLRVPV